ncbi:MAG: elongation factor G [Dehalococcoidia bacterium]
MKEYQPCDICNVALVGHGSTGKTSLSEAMLHLAGVINRLGRVDEGSTTSDFDPDEVKRKISVNVSLLPLEWKGTKINLIDTPGYADFVGEEKSGLRAADAAVVVVDASAGVQVGSEYAWQFANERNLPRIAFVNRIDRENADFDRTVESICSHFGRRCTPLEIPIGTQEHFEGVIDLLSMKACMGQKGEETAIPAELIDKAREYRERLIEAIAENDDELINKFLEGEELSEEELHRGLRNGVRSGAIVPIIVGCATREIGMSSLLDSIVQCLPSALEAGEVTATTPTTGQQEQLTADPAAPLAALVFKTTADPYVGRLSFVRVFSGTLKSDSPLWNGNKREAERVGQIFYQRGKSQEPTTHIGAGDIGVIPKLTGATTGDTLCTREHPLVLDGLKLPAPAFSAAVSPKTNADADKVGVSLHRIVEEDPTLSVGRDPDTGELILSGLGESHVEVAAEKMHRKFGVGVDLKRPRVAYRETITVSTSSEYRHKKQTGGAGQFGQVTLKLEPQPRGSGVEFSEAVVGGSVPREFFPAVEKGVHEAAREGAIAHYPLVDIKVTLVDGKYHPVDSKAVAFEIAGLQAVKQGVQQAKPILLEPVQSLQIRVPESFVGDVISDLNSRRAKVHGMRPDEGMTLIEAEAPKAEVQRYATDLRSITQGRGSFTSEFHHYEEVPAHIAQKVIEDSKKEAAAKG